MLWLVMRICVFLSVSFVVFAVKAALYVNRHINSRFPNVHFLPNSFSLVVESIAMSF